MTKNRRLPLGESCGNFGPPVRERAFHLSAGHSREPFSACLGHFLLLLFDFCSTGTPIPAPDDLAVGQEAARWLPRAIYAALYDRSLGELVGSGVFTQN
jgi:hypothetical protein